MGIFKNQQTKSALMIGTVSALSYWICYVVRNILSVLSPQIVETTDITVEFIGVLSTANMISYAIGQLVNGVIGERIKAKYLVSGGLVAAGFCIALLGLTQSHTVIFVAYTMVGFFLSAIFAPLVKVIAENLTDIYALRCCLGLSFATLLGSPTAGVVAMYFQWKIAFIVCGAMAVISGAGFFLLMVVLEKKGTVQYRERRAKRKESGSIKVLIEHEIIKYSLISVLTGIVRTSVLFWVPTYLSQHLGFSPSRSATIFTVITCVLSAFPYINSLLLYERIFKRDRNKSLVFAFSTSMLSFLMMFAISNRAVNIVFVLAAVAMNQGASGLLWNVYCPSLGETGLVSTATGYLDFLSYMAAALANLLFANAISVVGWQNLILVWAGLMASGVILVLPWRKWRSGKSKRIAPV